MTTAYKRTALIGGTTTALDGIDGSLLSNGDFAFVFYNNVNYIYQLDADLGGSESSPDIIAPDENAGAKRWVLQACRDASATAKGIVELATGSEVLAGTDTSKVITPAGLTSKISTSSTLGENSDLMIPSQKSVRTYVDTATVGYSLSDDVTLSGESTTKSPTEHAVKGYADTFIPKVSADNTLSGESTTVAASESAVAGFVRANQTLVSNDALFSGESTVVAASEKAVVDYVGSNKTQVSADSALSGESTVVAASESAVAGYVEANKTLVSADITLSGESTAVAAAEKAVKDYVDNAITASGNAVPIGHLSGLVVSRKDNDEVYVSGGSIEIGGVLYNSDEQLTGSGGSLADVYGSTNLVVASSVSGGDYSQHTAVNLSDGNTTTPTGENAVIWATPVVVDFGSNKIVGKVRIYVGTQASNAKVEYGTNGSDYTEIYSGAVSGEAWKELTGEWTARYVKISYVSGGNLYLREVQAYELINKNTSMYVYVDPPSSGTELAAENLIISRTAPSFDSAKGGYYHPTNTDQRAIAHFTTDASGHVPTSPFVHYQPLPAVSSGSSSLDNIGLAASVASNALTVSLKGANGSDPSSSNVVTIGFRSSTLATGTPVQRTVTSALSITLSAGSTLGFTAAEAGRLYVWAIDNAGAVELALSRTADIFPEDKLVSTTAEGGAGAADSAAVMYSATARTSVACRCLGYIEITTGATAGEWDNSPSKIQVMGPGVKRTGDIVQKVVYSTTAQVSGNTALPSDDTIPQITEGAEMFSQAITPTSAINKLVIDVQMEGSAGVNAEFGAALFQDSNADALTANIFFVSTGHTMNHRLVHAMVAGTASATTFKVRAGNSAGNMYYLNSYGTTRIFGGVCRSGMEITEVFA